MHSRKLEIVAVHDNADDDEGNGVEDRENGGDMASELPCLLSAVVGGVV